MQATTRNTFRLEEITRQLTLAVTSRNQLRVMRDTTQADFNRATLVRNASQREVAALTGEDNLPNRAEKLTAAQTDLTRAQENLNAILVTFQTDNRLFMEAAQEVVDLQSMVDAWRALPCFQPLAGGAAAVYLAPMPAQVAALEAPAPQAVAPAPQAVVEIDYRPRGGKRARSGDAGR